MGLGDLRLVEFEMGLSLEEGLDASHVALQHLLLAAGD